MVLLTIIKVNFNFPEPVIEIFDGNKHSPNNFPDFCILLGFDI